MRESKEEALMKFKAVRKSESFRRMGKEGLKSSFGEYNDVAPEKAQHMAKQAEAEFLSVAFKRDKQNG